MDERQSEKLSAIADGEAVFDDVMSKLVASNADFRKQWESTHLIRDVMRGHPVSREVMTLSQRVSLALENEPTVLAPKQHLRTRKVLKQAGGIAIAATIAVAAVLTVQQPGISPGNQTVTIASIPPTAGNNVQTVASRQEMPRVSTAVERKLSSYIVNHNEYSATSNMQGMLPYVRIVGYVPTRQVANEK